MTIPLTTGRFDWTEDSGLVTSFDQPGHDCSLKCFTDVAGRYWHTIVENARGEWLIERAAEHYATATGRPFGPDDETSEAWAYALEAAAVEFDDDL